MPKHPAVIRLSTFWGTAAIRESVMPATVFDVDFL
jgi:hypothetical protein